jgi:hypothetical protein
VEPGLVTKGGDVETFLLWYCYINLAVAAYGCWKG